MGINLSNLQNKYKEDLLKKINCESSADLNFTNEELSICDLPIQKIQELLLIGKNNFNLVKLIQMYHFRKLKDQNSHNSMTDSFYDIPIQRAQKLQQELSKNGKEAFKKYPLLGCVMSIKDHLRYKGTDCTFGLLALCDKPYKKTAPFIEFMENKGAIVTTKGNMSQFGLLIESHSTAYGDVKNKHDVKRTSGGSSGGEASLLSNGLVNFSIGSDIGGSIRIPALFEGVCGFKPTAERIPDVFGNFFKKTIYKNTAPSSQKLILKTIGPLCRHISEMELFFEILNEFMKQSIEIAPVTWNLKIKVNKVGKLKSFDSILEPTLTMKRAFNEGCKTLEEKGFELVELDINDIIEDIIVNTYAIMLKGEDNWFKVQKENFLTEPIHTNIKNMVFVNSLSSSTLEKKIDNDEIKSRTEYIVKAFLLSRSESFLDLQNRREKLLEEVTNRFRKNDLTTALTYGCFHAFNIGTSDKVGFQVIYTIVWNYFNFPAAVVPITNVRNSEEIYKSDWNDNLIRDLAKDCIGSTGLPVGVQVVGLPWRDEDVFYVLKNVSPKEFI